MHDSNESELSEQYVLFKNQVSKYDNIRFQPYRIACKLRYFQKLSKFYLIDLFNTIECFRQSGLNGHSDLSAVVPASEVYAILFNAYTQLKQRAPPSEQVTVKESADTVFTWLLEVYSIAPNGLMNIFGLKIALTLLCSSTYSNKLKYLFTLLSNEQGFLVEFNLYLFLRYITAIASYFDANFNAIYNEEIHSSLFNFSALIDVKQFVETLGAFENQHELTSWLVVYHRMPSAELLHHPFACNTCERKEIVGFRYKCKKCNNYNLCQDCFWTGKTSNGHDPNRHACKEYLYERPKNSLRQSLRNSFRCFPNKNKQNLLLEDSKNDDLTTKRLNLSNVITSPKATRYFTGAYEYKFNDLASESSDISVFSEKSDNEHKLIAHYLYLLQKNRSRQAMYEIANNQDYENTIDDLEQKNRELMLQISQLKQRGPNQAKCNGEPASKPEEGNVFLQELYLLRRKKHDLEDYLASLQDKRKNLMFQLDLLMKEFKDFEMSPGSDAPDLTSTETSLPTAPDSEVSSTFDQRQLVSITLL